MRYFSLIITILLIGLSSCSDNKTVFIVTPDAIPTFVSSGGSYNLSVTSSDEWEVEINDQGSEWVSVTPAYGIKGTTHLKISVTENLTFDNRTAKIVFKSGAITKTLSILQKQNNILAIPQKDFTVAAKGCDLKIQLTTNIKYELTVQESWIHILESIDPESNFISVKIDKNSTGEKRIATLTIKGEGMSESIIITQEANISSDGTIDDMPIEKF